MPRKKLNNSERVMIRLKKPTICRCKRSAVEKMVPLSSYLRTVIEEHAVAATKDRA